MKKIILLLLGWVSCMVSISAQLFIDAGTTLTVNQSGTICLENTSIQNNGILNDNAATFLFKENIGSSDQTISGNGVSIFHHIDVQMQSYNVKLLQNVNLNGTVSFVSGNFDLNGNDILLGSNATLSGENESASFTGSNGGNIILQVDLNGPNGVNPGNLGAELTTAENLGMTTIERKQQIINNNGAQSIARQYSISPSHNSGLNATLRFNYLDSELNGIPENELELWRNGGSGWQNMGFTTRNGSSNYIELTGINAFSTWTATNQANALPVELLQFMAVDIGTKVNLTWRTASETQNAHFLLQHSTHGRTFQDLAQIPGQGNSQQENSYEYLHEKPSPGTNYYRLKQVDFDGNYEYSKVISVDMILKPYHIFPNPNQTGELTVQFSAGQTDEVSFRIFDSFGKLVLEQFAEKTEAENGAAKLDMKALVPGIYILEARIGATTHFERVARQ